MRPKCLHAVQSRQSALGAHDWHRALSLHGGSRGLLRESAFSPFLKKSVRIQRFCVHTYHHNIRFWSNLSRRAPAPWLRKPTGEHVKSPKVPIGRLLPTYVLFSSHILDPGKVFCVFLIIISLIPIIDYAICAKKATVSLTKCSCQRGVFRYKEHNRATG
jgi:hypothetical protein